MTLNSYAKFKEKLTCGFKYDTRNLVIFTQPIESLNISFQWAVFVPRGSSYKNTEEFSFTTLNSDAKFA